MKVNYDSIADCMYITYQDKKVAFSKETGEGSVFDFDEFGGIVGIEIIGLKNILSINNQKEKLEKVISF